MKNLLDVGRWLRALGQPLVLLGLAVDLFPIVGVLLWGWNAVPLVMLYWMENIIAGVLTLPRILISGASLGVFGILLGAGLCLFFVFHYGLFCAVHGTFLTVFISISDGTITEEPSMMMDIGKMFLFGMNSGLHVDYFVYAIIAFQVIVLIWEFVIKGEWKATNPVAEMFAPYGRIVVLHIAIFAGAFGLFALGQPVIGVLALILFRAIYGVIVNSDGVFAVETDFSKSLEKMRDPETFRKALRGEQID